MKQLEDRTKSGKDTLFQLKKELQRLITDLDEDNRRFDLIRMQTIKIEKQKEHLEGSYIFCLFLLFLIHLIYP